MEQIETTISGIPCIVKVLHYSRQEGSFSYNAPSDVDYYGYTDMEYEICDSRGRPAPWLEKKLTDKERNRLEEEINELFCAQQ